jgi:ribosome maturation factor RimP
LLVEAWADRPRFCFDQGYPRRRSRLDDREVSDEVADELFDVLAATVDRLGLDLVDLEHHSGMLRVVVDRPGGVDLDAIAEATRAVSGTLDDHDPFPGQRYTLEVSSPGVERPLRTPAQFARALGEEVSVRRRSGDEGERRVQGELTVVDDDGVTVAGPELPDGGVRIGYDQIDRARTVFTWGSLPRPSSRDRSGRARRARRSGQRASTAGPTPTAGG